MGISVSSYEPDPLYQHTLNAFFCPSHVYTYLSTGDNFFPTRPPSKTKPLPTNLHLPHQAASISHIPKPYYSITSHTRQLRLLARIPRHPLRASAGDGLVVLPAAGPVAAPLIPTPVLTLTPPTAVLAPPIVDTEDGSGGFSSVLYLTPFLSGFHTLSVLTSAVAIREPRGDQARVRIPEEDDVEVEMAGAPPRGGVMVVSVYVCVLEATRPGAKAALERGR